VQVQREAGCFAPGRLALHLEAVAVGTDDARLAAIRGGPERFRPGHRKASWVPDERAGLLPACSADPRERGGDEERARLCTASAMEVRQRQVAGAAREANAAV
jgi:hypothetical protein